MSKWTEKVIEDIKNDLDADDNLKFFLKTGGRIRGFFDPIDASKTELEMKELQERYKKAIERLESSGKREIPILNPLDE